MQFRIKIEINQENNKEPSCFHHYNNNKNNHSLYSKHKNSNPMEKNSNQKWDPNTPKSYALSGKIMLSSIIILLAIVVIMVILHIYARWYLLRVRRRYLHRRRQRANQIIFYVDPSTTTGNGNGLDVSILNALPTFAYSVREGGLECAVCLSEFEENEMGRQLPGCHHCFHVDCIDMWFHSHSTCPICRVTVEVEVESDSRDKNKIIVNPEINLALVREPGSSSGLSERRKGMDLSGVRIEVPRRSELDDESRSESHEFRSPLYSLRRILSMKRRTTPSSPSPSGGSSSGRGCMAADPDIESGRGESTRPQTPR